MSDELVERVIGGLRVRIDRTLCVGFGDCVTAAPDAFILDSEDIAVYRSRMLASCMRQLSGRRAHGLGRAG